MRLAEISVNDMIGLKNISFTTTKTTAGMSSSMSLLHFYKYKWDISREALDLCRVFRNAENLFHSNSKKFS